METHMLGVRVTPPSTVFTIQRTHSVVGVNHYLTWPLHTQQNFHMVHENRYAVGLLFLPTPQISVSFATVHFVCIHVGLLKGFWVWMGCGFHLLRNIARQDSKRDVSSGHLFSPSCVEHMNTVDLSFFPRRIVFPMCPKNKIQNLGQNI